MEKKILIPIDFRVASLNTLRLALEQNNNVPVKVIFLYAEFLNDSITDLLFYSPDKLIKSRISSEFTEALQILKNRFEGFSGWEIELLHTYNPKPLMQVLTFNKIDEIYIPKTYRLSVEKKAFDPIPLINELNFPVFEMEWENKFNQSEQEQLITLFN